MTTSITIITLFSGDTFNYELVLEERGHTQDILCRTKVQHIVDGRKAASVDVVNISLFTGLYASAGGAGFLPWTVFQTFP